jgi:hypothetical protein
VPRPESLRKSRAVSSRAGLAGASLQDVRWLAGFAVHVDGEASVVGEEGLLALSVAAVGAVCVCVEELAQGEPVGGFSRTELGVIGRG